MAKEPHPNYDPDAIRLSLGVLGNLFDKGSPAGKLTLAFVGGLAVMGGFFWIANHFADKGPPTYRGLALKKHAERRQRLLMYRSKVCTTNSAACIKWTEMALQCEKGRSVCSEMEAYRERVSGVPVSSDPGAYSF